MADEAVLFIETSLPIPYVCSNTTAITQGTVVKLTDEFLVAKTAAGNDLVAGITAADKIASDGVLTVPVYIDGFFKMVASGNITVGDPVATSDAAFLNRVASVVGTTNLSGNRILGISQGTATTGETVIIKLQPSVGYWNKV